MSEPTSSSPAAAAPVPAGLYRVDPNRSFLGFRAKAFGLVWVRGTMPAVDGSVRIEDGLLSGTGVIAASGVETGVKARDWHLRSSHYLNTAVHPEIALAVDGAAIDTGRADCTVTVRDTSSAVQLQITALDVVDGALHLRAVVELDRTPFPMLPPLAGVSRVVHIDLSVVALPSTS